MDARTALWGCLHTQEPLHDFPSPVRTFVESSVVLASALGLSSPMWGRNFWWAAQQPTALSNPFSGDGQSHSVLEGWEKVGSCLGDIPWLFLAPPSMPINKATSQPGGKGHGSVFARKEGREEKEDVVQTGRYEKGPAETALDLPSRCHPVKTMWRVPASTLLTTLLAVS